MPEKRKILGLKPGGKCEVLIKDRVNTEVVINVKDVEGNYIGEWTDRLIEIIIYQITEVVIPTVFTYQKYWTPKELKKMAVEFLLYEPFAQVEVNLSNITLQIPSMADLSENLCVEVKNCKIWNQRYHKKRIFNPDHNSIYPFKELETEAWTISCTDAQAFYQHKRGLTTYQKIALTNLFNLQVKHELPKKLPELSLVYTVVDDILDFPDEMKT